MAATVKTTHMKDGIHMGSGLFLHGAKRSQYGGLYCLNNREQPYNNMVHYPKWQPGGS